MMTLEFPEFVSVTGSTALLLIATASKIRSWMDWIGTTRWLDCTVRRAPVLAVGARSCSTETLKDSPLLATVVACSGVRH